MRRSIALGSRRFADGGGRGYDPAGTGSGAAWDRQIELGAAPSGGTIVTSPPCATATCLTMAKPGPDCGCELASGRGKTREDLLVLGLRETRPMVAHPDDFVGDRDRDVAAAVFDPLSIRFPIARPRASGLPLTVVGSAVMAIVACGEKARARATAPR